MRSIIISLITFLMMIFTPVRFRMDVPVTLKLFWINYNVSKTRVPIINSKVVKASAYNNTKNQCDSTPHIMAWNDKITEENHDQVVAISRDLEKIGLTKDTNIMFQVDDNIYSKTILDRMGRYARKGGRRKYKIKNSIDILMKKYRDAKKFGRKNIKIYWFAGQTELFEVEREANILVYKGNICDIFNPNTKILETSKLGYVKVQTSDGNVLYVSNKPPINPTMLTDFYQFTKMAMYLEAGKENEQSIFNLFYRHNPYNSGFSISMGVQDVIDYLKKLEITGNDVDFLKSNWEFPNKFWEYLRDGFKWDDKCILEALPDGTMAQAYVPLIQVRAPLPIADFIETRLLNITGGQTMVTTKAAKMTLANPDVPWLEMAARRAQSLDNALMISKCAYIGGGSGTSNALAGQLYGIPVSGTTSHSSVLAFETQEESMRTCADIFREKSIFIIDTFGYVQGTMAAIKVAKEKGLKTFGVRDDSEELAFHTQVIREILKANGFGNAKIVTSNDIDELLRVDMKHEHAQNDADGIGTMLVPGPFGVVYKPVQIGDRMVIKLSCQAKITDPCAKSVYRVFGENGLCDAYVEMIDNEVLREHQPIYHRDKNYEVKTFSKLHKCEKILLPMLQGESELYPIKTIDQLRENVSKEVAQMWPEIKRFKRPMEFPLWLSWQLQEVKNELMSKYKIVKEC